MASPTRAQTPAPADVVERVEAELRAGWWSSTLLASAPAVVAVLLGYLTTAAVLDGDWLAILFPGVIVMACTWVAAAIVWRAIAVKAAERRMTDDERRQAVYARGLSGTARLAAAQDPEAFGVLDPIWHAWTGRVIAVRRVGSRRGRGGVRDVLDVDVADRGRVVTARLVVAASRAPEVGRRCAVLEDPHHPRAVVDLRPRGRRRTGTGGVAARPTSATGRARRRTSTEG